MLTRAPRYAQCQGCTWCAAAVSAPAGAAKQTGALEQPTCSSSAVDDVAWKDCASFCSVSSKKEHCGLCKCKACGFCACESAIKDDADEEQCQSWCSADYFESHCVFPTDSSPHACSQTLCCTPQPLLRVIGLAQARCASARLATSARMARLASAAWRATRRLSSATPSAPPTTRSRTAPCASASSAASARHWRPHRRSCTARIPASPQTRRTSASLIARTTARRIIGTATAPSVSARVATSADASRSTRVTRSSTNAPTGALLTFSVLTAGERTRYPVCSVRNVCGPTARHNADAISHCSELLRAPIPAVTAGARARAAASARRGHRATRSCLTTSCTKVATPSASPNSQTSVRAAPARVPTHATIEAGGCIHGSKSFERRDISLLVDCEFCKCKQCDFCRAGAGEKAKALLPWQVPKAEAAHAAAANTCDSGIVGDTTVAACEPFCSRLGGAARACTTGPEPTNRISRPQALS